MLVIVLCQRILQTVDTQWLMVRDRSPEPTVDDFPDFIEKRVRAREQSSLTVESEVDQSYGAGL